MYHDGEAKDDVLPPYCLGDKKTLTSVVLPDVLKRIERNAFTRSGLTGSLNIPEGVVEIGDNAFLDNDFTGVLALPSTLKKIDSGAFANAAFICPLNLPDGIEEIGDDSVHQTTSQDSSRLHSYRDQNHPYTSGYPQQYMCQCR